MSFLQPGKIVPMPIMSPKLYCVTIEIELYVVALTEEEAEDIAKDVATGLDNPEPDFILAHEVTDPKRIPKDWLDGIPYGIETDEKTGDLLERLMRENPASYNHPAQQRLPFVEEEEVEWPQSPT